MIPLDEAHRFLLWQETEEDVLDWHFFLASKAVKHEVVQNRKTGKYSIYKHLNAVQAFGQPCCTALVFSRDQARRESGEPRIRTRDR